MSLNKVSVDKAADQRLRTLKARTGLTPNLLCRLGFCLSLAEPGIPEWSMYSGPGVRELHRSTLTGEWDALFFALLRERMAQDQVKPDELEPQFKAHLCRGIEILINRVRTMTDLANLLVSMNARGAAPNEEASHA